jgi:hypothetical protein
MRINPYRTPLGAGPSVLHVFVLPAGSIVAPPWPTKSAC